MLRIREKEKLKRNLIEQMELLHEASKHSEYDDGISRYSHEMSQIYKVLVSPIRTMIFGLVFLDFFIHLLIFVKKFRWR